MRLNELSPNLQSDSRLANGIQRYHDITDYIYDIHIIGWNKSVIFYSKHWLYLLAQRMSDADQRALSESVIRFKISQWDPKISRYYWLYIYIYDMHIIVGYKGVIFYSKQWINWIVQSVSDAAQWALSESAIRFKISQWDPKISRYYWLYIYTICTL